MKRVGSWLFSYRKAAAGGTAADRIRTVGTAGRREPHRSQKTARVSRLFVLHFGQNRTMGMSFWQGMPVIFHGRESIPPREISGEYVQGGGRGVRSFRQPLRGCKRMPGRFFKQGYRCGNGLFTGENIFKQDETVLYEQPHPGPACARSLPRTPPVRFCRKGHPDPRAFPK